ncbi:MAG: hydrogenase [Phycisphaerales bacterium]|nr:hydrogenase [Phycisphaerales bacterium]
MIGLLLAIGLLIISGIGAMIASARPRIATMIGVGGTMLGGLLGIIPAIQVLSGHAIAPIRLPWSVPYGGFYVHLDGLSAFFLIPMLGVPALAALYGSRYLSVSDGRRRLGTHWFYFNLLTACMALVLIARNGVLFLMAWEVMSLASFFLVTFDDEKEHVRQAGWTYLVAMHLGTAFLFVLFILLGKQSNSLDFDHLGSAVGMIPANAGLLFVLAIVGFGTKAGFLPMHVWLPEAHPAAPSHVSAVMSGVMIKTGIYGLLRTLTLLGPPAAWWGWLLIGIGLCSGVLGVLFALAQHDLKRLLAYHSVENIGIIALGLGVGVLGMSLPSTPLMVLGFAGGLLHVVNHALFKSLLFLGAGSVMHATGTGEIDHLGGLMKRMPWTAVTFLIGAIAISGLPPFNGFVSEFLIYVGGFEGVSASHISPMIAGLIVLGGLALIGGLAAACFTKAFGIIFLGEPRSAHPAQAHESPWAMRLPMLALASGCVLISLFAPLVFTWMEPVLVITTGLRPDQLNETLVGKVELLNYVVILGVVFMAVALILLLLRHRLLSRRQVTHTVTWDCGYARPSPRMQYTASSFVQPLTDLFAALIRTRHSLDTPSGLFPRHASLTTNTPDIWREHFYQTAFKAIVWFLARFRWLQHGHVQLYVLYIAITLLVLLVFKVG